VTNQTVDMISAGVDLAIRGHVGALPDSTLIQRPLAEVEWQLFAATHYIDAQCTVLTEPADINNHPTLALGWQSPRGRWALENSRGEIVNVKIAPRLQSDDMSTLKHAALCGAGIVALPSYTCQNELKRGRLQRVLPMWHAGTAGLSLVTPNRKGHPQSVLALQRYLLDRFAETVEATEPMPGRDLGS
ncbi:MAG: substrate binding domain-containing protein, partial [Pseudomonadota bacterium]